MNLEAIPILCLWFLILSPDQFYCFKPELKKVSRNKWVVTGRNCGITTKIKYSHTIPDNLGLNHECTMITIPQDQSTSNAPQMTKAEFENIPKWRYPPSKPCFDSEYNYGRGPGHQFIQMKNGASPKLCQKKCFEMYSSWCKVWVVLVKKSTKAECYVKADHAPRKRIQDNKLLTSGFNTEQCRKEANLNQ